MRILVLNRGSSSLKCALYEFDHLQEEPKTPLVALDHLDFSLFGQVDVIGHRIVHGGEFYKESVLIDASVKQNIALLSDLAPLHQLASLESIEMLEKKYPGVPQVAVFDTAFHRTLPQEATIYPGPYAWFEEGIHRYGFHGISFQYCARKVKADKMVICHLGAGASLCAVKGGKSVDTTMGFTPLEGLMMDTRSGSVDPGILLYLLSKKGTGVEELSTELYERSGLLGLSGLTGDMKTILEKAVLGEGRALLALEVYLHRLKKEIGSMIASLEGIDTLVFTGGIGEHAPLIRHRICKALAFLGLHIDEKKNNSAKQDGVLSLPNSQIKVLLLHAEEDFEIARECYTQRLIIYNSEEE